jgi:hypothetical protein
MKKLKTCLNLERKEYCKNTYLEAPKERWCEKCKNCVHRECYYVTNNETFNYCLFCANIISRNDDTDQRQYLNKEHYQSWCAVMLECNNSVNAATNDIICSMCNLNTHKECTKDISRKNQKYSICISCYNNNTLTHNESYEETPDLNITEISMENQNEPLEA